MSQSPASLAEFNYLPTLPAHYRPKVGLIGCGGITHEHLRAYRDAGIDVVALCDLRIERAQLRQTEYFPAARVTDSYREVLEDAAIEVVDIATHPDERIEIVRAALQADKHVLSQKPFALDLDVGLSLVELAEQRGLYLAVNQNGRWAPHFSYARNAVASGLLGEVFAAHLGCHWDHTWTAGTDFERIKHLILYDYAIHWFDMLRCFFPGKTARRVFASTARVPHQRLKPSLLAQVLIEFDEGQATLAFDAGVVHGQLDQTFLGGTAGTLLSHGPSIQQQTVTVTTAAGTWTPALGGQWFPDGFLGTMGELLCAIEAKRPCSISARDNLDSLALCFAAIASADSGTPQIPGAVRRLET